MEASAIATASFRIKIPFLRCHSDSANSLPKGRFPRKRTNSASCCSIATYIESWNRTLPVPGNTVDSGSDSRTPIGAGEAARVARAVLARITRSERWAIGYRQRLPLQAGNVKYIQYFQFHNLPYFERSGTAPASRIRRLRGVWTRARDRLTTLRRARPVHVFAGAEIRQRGSLRRAGRSGGLRARSQNK